MLRKKKDEDLSELWYEYKDYTPSMPMKKEAERRFSMESGTLIKEFEIKCLNKFRYLILCLIKGKNIIFSGQYKK